LRERNRRNCLPQLTSGRPSSLRIRGSKLRSSLRSLYAGTIAWLE
jgi:hypothetical protein